MASTFSDLGIELMATGENAGTWGTKTNTNLQIVEKAIAGYVEKSIAGGAQTTTLSITDGDTTESTSVARHAVIKLTGTITGNQIVTVPDSIEKVYIVVNGTSGSFTVQFKTASGTGITFGASDKGTRLLFSDGTNIVDTATGNVGSYDLNGETLILDADQDTTITADTDDQIDIAIAGADDFRFTANTFTALSGSSVVIPDGGLTLGSTAVTSTAAELNILDGVTSTAAELNILDGVTSTAAELNLLDGITAGTVSASLAVIVDSNKDISGFRNLSITGDLTVSGDDITMGTNTAGNLLIADGTNFNSVAVGSLSEISTVASDDVLLAVDTSGGGLKKITRATLTAGIVSGSEISNVVEDTSPQLGGDLDTNSRNILIDDAHFIADENGNEQIIFQTTSSAVNQFDITNAATGNAPEISATGGDTNIDLKLTPKGSGQVVIDGNVGIDTGVIDLKNGGSQSVVRFYCESSNAHYAQIQAPAHSDFSGNVTLTLPATTDTLVGIAATQTLTNKTLTTPVIAEIDSGSTITLDATTDIILDADGDNITMKAAGTTVLDFVLNGATDVTLDAPGDLKFDADGGDFNFLDGGTEILRISNSSSDVIIRPVVDAKDLIFQQRDGTEVARIEDNGTFNVVTDKLAINGTAVTSTAAELNILDGVTSTATELNVMDGDTSATSTTLADADRLVTNDAGTMKQVALTDVKTYLTSAGFSTDDPTALAIALG